MNKSWLFNSYFTSQHHQSERQIGKPAPQAEVGDADRPVAVPHRKQDPVHPWGTIISWVLFPSFPPALPPLLPFLLPSFIPLSLVRYYKSLINILKCISKTKVIVYIHLLNIGKTIKNMIASIIVWLSTTEKQFWSSNTTKYICEFCWEAIEYFPFSSCLLGKSIELGLMRVNMKKCVLIHLHFFLRCCWVSGEKKAEWAIHPYYQQF